MTQRRENDRVARAMVGKPIYAWDDPKEGCDPPLIRYPAAIAATVPRKHSEPKVDGHTHHHRRQGEHKRCCYRLNYHRHQEQPSFYDKEALEEKLRDFKAEKLDLSHKDVELRSRFAAAKDTLLAMRSKKRDLSTAKALDKLVNAGGNTNRGTTARAREPYLFSKERSHESHKESDSRREERAERRQELTSFALKDRIMECDLLNDQLKKGQAAAESKTMSLEGSSEKTKVQLKILRQKLQAMPKRFTKSLQTLQDEVENLRTEKLSLQLAEQKRTWEETDLVASARSRQTCLKAEMDLLLDEIDDTEDDRDKYRRSLRVESTRADFLQTQRDEAFKDLRARFGEDAVERAAFTSAACRLANEEEGNRDNIGPPRRRGLSMGIGALLSVGVGTSCGHGDDYGGVDRRDNAQDFGDDPGVGDAEVDARSCYRRLPLTSIAEALRPPYGPEESMTLTTEAVLKAARDCGLDAAVEGVNLTSGTGADPDEEEGGLKCGTVNFEEFCAVTKQIKVGG